MKYEIATYIEIIVSKSDSRFSSGSDKTSEQMLLMAKQLSEGYEIYQAIPFSTSTSCGIKYILRRRIEENNA